MCSGVCLRTMILFMIQGKLTRYVYESEHNTQLFCDLKHNPLQCVEGYMPYAEFTRNTILCLYCAQTREANSTIIQ